jgi:transcriptional regulator with XRE-family HTH domain
MATEYGKRLRLARKFAKLTQEGLRDRTGIPQSTISTAEREGYGSSDTPIYARVCGVDTMWLTTGEGAMIPFAPPKDEVASPSPPEDRRSPDRSQQIAGLTPAALDLALLFDEVKDRIERAVAHQAATAAILRVLQKIESPASGAPGSHYQPQTQTENNPDLPFFSRTHPTTNTDLSRI